MSDQSGWIFLLYVNRDAGKFFGAGLILRFLPYDTDTGCFVYERIGTFWTAEPSLLGLLCQKRRRIIEEGDIDSGENYSEAAQLTWLEKLEIGAGKQSSSQDVGDESEDSEDETFIIV